MRLRATNPNSTRDTDDASYYDKLVFVPAGRSREMLGTTVALCSASTPYTEVDALKESRSCLLHGINSRGSVRDIVDYHVTALFSRQQPDVVRERL